MARCREISFRPADDLEVHVQLLPATCAGLLSHCEQSNVHGHEICGLILGTVKGPFRRGQLQEYRLIATDVLPFKTSDASGAHVSASEEAWAQAAEEIETRFQGKERLGWYHTHPTQGIFFSAQDKDFHSVFTRPFQLALVVDARSLEAGLFYWRDRAANEISDVIAVDLRPPRALSRQAAPSAAAEASPNLRGRYRLWILLAGLFWFAGSLEAAKTDAFKLVSVSLLFLAALLLRIWSSWTALPSRRETLDGSRPPKIAARPLVLILLSMSLGSMLLAFVLSLRPSTSVSAQSSLVPTDLLKIWSQAWHDPFYRLVLLGLLIWLLFEVSEARLHWSSHLWVPRIAGLRPELAWRVLAGLNLLMAGALAGLGLLTIVSALGSEHGGGLRAGAIGVGAVSFAATAAWLILTELWQHEGTGDAAGIWRRNVP